MSKTKYNYLKQSVILTLLVGIAEWCILSYGFQAYFSGYPVIPLYFLVLNIISFYIIDVFAKPSPNRMVQIFLTVKVLRIALSVLLMMIYCISDKGNVKCFLVTFIVTYLIYMVHDAWFFSSFEMKPKKVIEK